MTIRKASQEDALNISAVGAWVWIDTYATEGVFNYMFKYIAPEFSVQKLNDYALEVHSISSRAGNPSTSN